MLKKNNNAFTAVIYGRVQGVGFRYSACDKARRLRLMGWVRNNYNGSVEVVCEGSAERLNEFYSWLKTGPTGAFVTDIQKKDIKPCGLFRDFSIDF